MPCPIRPALCVGLLILALPARAQTLPPGLTTVGYMAAPATGDLDGDGDGDVLVGRADGTVAFYENTAAAGAAAAFTARAGAMNPLAGASVGFAAAPALGDLDGDGDLDALVGRGDGTLSFFRNTTSATTRAVFVAAALPAGLAGVGTNSIPAICDLDGDGDLDVVVGRTDGTLAYFENTAGVGAPAAFVARSGAQNPLGSVDVGFSSAPAFFDADRDGDLDLIVGNVNGEIRRVSNTAALGTAPVFGAPTLLVDLGYSAVPAIADLDGDGDADVLVGTSTGAFVPYSGVARSPQTATLAGAAGWRMLTSPVQGGTFADLLGPIWTQGVPGADYAGGAPNVLRYDETVATGIDAGYGPPASLGDAVGAGRGAYVYVYRDDVFGTPGTFPKTLSVSGTARTTPFTWGIDGPLMFTSSGDAAADGWNLLGNPFGSWIDWDATTGSGLDAAVYVYDPGTVQYRAYSRGVGGTLLGGVLGAFQGFWAHTTAAGARLTAAPTPSTGGPLYGREADAVSRLRLTLAPAEGSGLPTDARSEALIALGAEGARAQQDPLDAYALAPPAPAYVLLSTVAEIDDASVGLAVDARPLAPAEVALVVAALSDGAPAGGAFTLSWDAAEALPDGWSAHLLDRETGATLDLATAGTYAFTLAAPAARGTSGSRPDARREDAAAVPALGAPAVVRPAATAALSSGRFAVSISGRAVSTVADAPAALALSAPTPNPTAATATLRLDLPEPATVTAVLYDALGRRVAVLVDGQQAAGTIRLTVDAAALPAGLYVVRADVRGAEVRTLARRLLVAH